MRPLLASSKHAGENQHWSPSTALKNRGRYASVFQEAVESFLKAEQRHYSTITIPHKGDTRTVNKIGAHVIQQHIRS